MEKVYIKNYGVYQEFAQDSSQLKLLIENNEKICLNDLNYYDYLNSNILDRSIISREDRSIVNTMSKLTINALIDFFKKDSEQDYSKSYLYTASDGEEHSFANIFEICDKYKNDGSIWKHIQEYKDLSNPLEMLRSLPTNVLYNLSKLLDNHEEGIPLNATSLSGMVALRLAYIDIANSIAKNGACIASAADMKSFNSLVVFKKLAEIKESDHDLSGIIPSWGAAVVYMDNDSNNALAQLLSVETFYVPKINFAIEDWEELFKSQLKSQGRPDIIISYSNGINSQKLMEYNLLNKYFPDTKIINYKVKTGYTGKLNNILDILCAINDNNIGCGAKIMVNGMGMNYGYGATWLIKH